MRLCALTSIVGIDTLQLSVNIDGLPLFKSSAVSFWPILCAIANVKPCYPFVVAVFCGTRKPSDFNFVSDTIQDLKQLIESGFQYNDKHLAVELHSIVCDAPAKCMMKGIIQYNGYYGCDRCEEKGVYDGRMLFLDTTCRLRSDQSFRQQSNKQHHKELSPFCVLDIDMIQRFPLDYMHVLNLGVMKRLLLLWISGPLKTRTSANQIAQISNKLDNIKKYMPCEFVRKPRSLQHVRLWKATEYRQFLMYTGPFVLKDILTKRQYDHFMCLHVGVCILMNVELVAQHSEYARQLLHYFVLESIEIYGRKFVTYNVHCLVHLPDVAVFYGSLENCSAYKFENYLQRLKRLVRSGRRPLAQVSRRIAEMEHHVIDSPAACTPLDL